MVYTAFLVVALDGTNAALPILRLAYDTKATNLWWPKLFYLPEDVSEDPDWLAFWQQQGLSEYIELRRSKKRPGHIGLWKDRTPR